MNLKDLYLAGNTFISPAFYTTSALKRITLELFYELDRMTYKDMPHDVADKDALTNPYRLNLLRILEELDKPNQMRPHET